MPGFKNKRRKIGAGLGLSQYFDGVAKFFLNGGDTANPEVGGTGLAWSVNNNGGDGPSETSVLVHTVPENSWDEVYLWASNINSSNQTLNMFFNPLMELLGYEEIQVTVEAEVGSALVLPGLIFPPGTPIYLKGSSSSYIRIHGVIVRRYLADEDDVTVGLNGDKYQ